MESKLASENGEYPYTHTHSRTRELRNGRHNTTDTHTWQSRDTRTNFDRNDLESLHQTHTTQQSIGERETTNNNGNNSSHAYRTESRMEVNEVNIQPTTHTTAMAI